MIRGWVAMRTTEASTAVLSARCSPFTVLFHSHSRT